MREIHWQENILNTEKTIITISGTDNFFCNYLEPIIKDILLKTQLQFIPRSLRIHVFSGMTLPEVYKKCLKEKRAQECHSIVFCSGSCIRMLTGTKNYERALFIEKESSVLEIYTAILQWLRDYNSIPGLHITTALKARDYPVMHIVINGRSPSFESRKYSRDKKTVYGWLSQFADRIGTRNRQETYLKTRLVIGGIK